MMECADFGNKQYNDLATVKLNLDEEYANLTTVELDPAGNIAICKIYKFDSWVAASKFCSCGYSSLPVAFFVVDDGGQPQRVHQGLVQ